MKTASEFRLAAREALKGKWWLAVGVGIVASILGGQSSGFNVNIELPFPNGSSDTVVPPSVDAVNPSWESIEEGFASILPWIVGVGIFALLLGLVMGVAYFILGSIIGVGYTKFNLNLIDGREATFGNLFAYFSDWKRTTAASLLRALYIFLWTLLAFIVCLVPTVLIALLLADKVISVVCAVIAGILVCLVMLIISLNYAMTDYILAEEPELAASEVIRDAKTLIHGHRWRLFCLQLSFIGWQLLSILFTLGIGHLWIIPYQRTAIADFYREISDTRPVPETDDFEYPFPET